MKTTIDLDEAKLKRVMNLTGITTRKEAVDYALTEAERLAKIKRLYENPLPGSDDVGDFNDVFGRWRHGFCVRLDLNILSMRSVMMNPPTALLVAATMATVPSTVASVLLCSPARMMAPTTAIASRALVSDIN